LLAGWEGGQGALSSVGHPRYEQGYDEGEYLMRRAGFRVRAGGMAALVCAVSLAGCKKQEPAPAAPPPATEAPKVTEAPAPAAQAPDTASAAAVEADTPRPFHFKDVKISHSAGKVSLTYTLENHGRKRARGMSCLWLHDKDGLFIDNVSLGPISLKGGESDVFEDAMGLPTDLWTQTATVQLYAAANCHGDTLEQTLSEPRRLDTTGKPPLEDVPPANRAQPPEAGTAVFVVKDVSLSQAEPSDPVSVTYTVTNNAAARVRGRLCVRLFDAAGTTSTLDEADVDSFNLAPGGSETFTTEVILSEDKHWDSAARVKVFASGYGCIDKEKEALSNIVAFPKPESIHAPREVDESAESHDDTAPPGEEGSPGDPTAEPVPDYMQVDDMSGEPDPQVEPE
jgi:hypothetical protein